MKIKLLLMALLLIIPGCGKKENTQKSPEGTIRIFAENLTQMNKQGFMAVIDGKPLEKEVLGNMLELVGTMEQFRKDIVAQYGETAGADFQKAGSMSGKLDLASLNKKIDEMKIDIQGDKATCTFPDDEKPMALVKKEGLWYIDSSTIKATDGIEADLKKVSQMWSLINSNVQKLRKKVGQENVTVDSLKKELGETMMNAFITTLAPEMKMDMEKMKMNMKNGTPNEMPKMEIKIPSKQD
ncbi:MAG: hypothetical protein K9M57_10855 [Phycisphaerae bacterium]|nr:hypothetical protein [Phycisphaerae bacterium]